MAKTNKYSSINFNDIFDKKLTSPSSSKNPATGKTALANSRIHGHMLVLTKPAAAKPKPIIASPPPPSQSQSQSPSPSPSPPVADQVGPVPADSISLRSQGRTGTGSPLAFSPAKPASPLPKSDRFVPPHLRPGFAGREEKPVPQGYSDGRPKSGGGYDRMRIIGEPEHFTRPGSSG